MWSHELTNFESVAHVQRICYAINEGNVDEIVALLTSGVDVNLRLKVL